MESKEQKREMRRKRIRAKVKGTELCPRLSVFRSNAHIYAQIIDDGKKITLVSAYDTEADTKIKGPLPEWGVIQEKIIDKKTIGIKDKIYLAYIVGKLIAEKAKKIGIEKIVFDRGGNKYHGRVKALAEGARAGGLIF